MTLLLRAYVPQDVSKAWRLVLLGSYLYHSVLGFWFHKSQCSLFSCPSVMERLKRSSGGLVPPVWWRTPVLETQRRWKKNSSYLLRNPYLLKEGFCGGGMRWRKLLVASPGLSEAVVPVGVSSWTWWHRELAEGGLVLGSWKEGVKRTLAPFCELGFRKIPQNQAVLMGFPRHHWTLLKPYHRSLFCPASCKEV